MQNRGVDGVIKACRAGHLAAIHARLKPSSGSIPRHAQHNPIQPPHADV